MTEFLHLAERCEQAARPDREIDHAIYEALGMPVVRLASATTYATDLVNWAPFYTASLDAAMTLVPDGWLMAGLSARNCRLPNWIWKAVLWHPDADANVQGIARQADTPALALCAASLRARAQSEHPEQDNRDA